MSFLEPGPHGTEEYTRVPVLVNLLRGSVHQTHFTLAEAGLRGIRSDSCSSWHRSFISSSLAAVRDALHREHLSLAGTRTEAKRGCEHRVMSN